MKNIIFSLLGGLLLLSSYANAATCDSLGVCGADVTVTTFKDASIVIGYAGELVIDPDGNASSRAVFDNSDVTVGLVSQPELFGNFTTNTFTFDPNGEFDNLMAGETGTATFSYYVASNSGVGPIEGTVTINVKGEELANLDGVNCENLICANSITVETHKSQSIIIGDDDAEQLIFNHTGNDSSESINLRFIPDKGITTINDQNQIVFDPNGEYSDIPEGESQNVSVAYNIYSENTFLSSPVNGMGEVIITISGSGEVPPNSEEPTDSEVLPFVILHDKDIPSEDDIIRPYSATIALALTANKNHEVDELVALIELDLELQAVDSYVVKNYIEGQALEDYDLNQTDYEISINALGTHLEFDIPEMAIGDSIVVIAEVTTLDRSANYHRYDIEILQKSTLEEVQFSWGPVVSNHPYKTSSISLLVAMLFMFLFSLYVMRIKQYKAK